MQPGTAADAAATEIHDHPALQSLPGGVIEQLFNRQIYADTRAAADNVFGQVQPGVGVSAAAASPGAAPQIQGQVWLPFVPGLPARPSPGTKKQALAPTQQRMAWRQRRQPAIHHPQQAMGLIGGLAAGSAAVHPITTQHLLQPAAALACGGQP